MLALTTALIQFSTCSPVNSTRFARILATTVPFLTLCSLGTPLRPNSFPVGVNVNIDKSIPAPSLDIYDVFGALLEFSTLAWKHDDTLMSRRSRILCHQTVCLTYEGLEESTPATAALYASRAWLLSADRARRQDTTWTMYGCEFTRMQGNWEIFTAKVSWSRNGALESKPSNLTLPSNETQSLGADPISVTIDPLQGTTPLSLTWTARLLQSLLFDNIFTHADRETLEAAGYTGSTIITSTPVCSRTMQLKFLRTGFGSRRMTFATVVTSFTELWKRLPGAAGDSWWEATFLLRGQPYAELQVVRQTLVSSGGLNGRPFVAGECDEEALSQGVGNSTGAALHNDPLRRISQGTVEVT